MAINTNFCVKSFWFRLEDKMTSYYFFIFSEKILSFPHKSRPATISLSHYGPHPTLLNGDEMSDVGDRVISTTDLCQHIVRCMRNKNSKICSPLQGELWGWDENLQKTAVWHCCKQYKSATLLWWDTVWKGDIVTVHVCSSIGNLGPNTVLPRNNVRIVISNMMLYPKS